MFSPSWYRVAKLKARLRSHVDILRHSYRDRVWFVLQDHATGRSHRLSPAAYRFIGLMDGNRTVQELWDLVNAQASDEAPNQDDVIRLLGQLHAADALICDVPPDTRELFRRFRKHERLRWRQRLRSPLSIKVPLFDPDRFLDRTLWLVRPLFHWSGFLAWLVLVVVGAVFAGVHWEAITNNIVDQALAPQNLLLLWLIYPLVKTVHELGHAYAVKLKGGEVHEIGIMFLVFIPVPYVDASAASGFPDKRQRMLVGAIGIMVEMALAVVALFIWLNAEVGPVHAVAYNVMLIGGVSTVLFNGNPLLRFDGYYVLSDAIEIPNLGQRANTYYFHLIRRYLFGNHESESPAHDRGERAWFVFYGAASFIYRFYIILIILLYVGTKFFVIGVVLALWAAITQVATPITKAVSYMVSSPQLRRNRRRALTVSAALLAGFALLLFVLPVPLWTRAEGVTWPAENSQVQGLELQYLSVRNTDRVEAGVIQQEIAVVRSDLERTKERAASLIVLSPRSGSVVMPNAADLPARYIKKGQLVAYVIDAKDRLTARTIVTQDDVQLVRDRTRSVQIVSSEWSAASAETKIVREVPGGTKNLPSPALGALGGGRIAIDPRDSKGVTALERVFEFEVVIPEGAERAHVGQRINVRFDHGYEPVGFQIYRSFRQLFLRLFDV